MRMTGRILIIEDNDMSYVLADYLLRQKGYSTVRALDGGAGVEAALHEPVDLILCDLDLPVMDGYEVLGALRANDAWHPVPVLAFTGDSPGKEHSALLEAGFAAYVFKPPDPRTFAATIAQYIAPHEHAS
jgi:CheY-like chemotaxis protein